MDVFENELQGLYSWVDEIPLSRPKRNIARDFSDGVLMAEVISYFHPKLVELHNYSSANGLQQKLYNWNTLNAKVFRRLGFIISKQDCEDACNCKPGAVERILKMIKIKLAKYKEDPSQSSSMPPQAQAPAPVQAPNVPVQMPLKPSTANGTMQAAQLSQTQEALNEKDQTISEIKEANQILETKVRKLEQLVRLKDAKIQTLMAKLQGAGLA
mmetsp:Transcript_19140/g.34635  ORF Transcript_19140/g.34635 Transcript_19140/m.34635 type:complete len:213 (-) Transcript_19140:311-949(-)